MATLKISGDTNLNSSQCLAVEINAAVQVAPGLRFDETEGLKESSRHHCGLKII